MSTDNPKQRTNDFLIQHCRIHVGVKRSKQLIDPKTPLLDYILNNINNKIWGVFRRIKARPEAILPHSTNVQTINIAAISVKHTNYS